MDKIADTPNSTEQAGLDRVSALPFVKWAGSKLSVIPAITRYFPDQVDTYWEPFVGGGAVFFSFAERIKRAYLSDINLDLVLTYKVVRDNVEGLIALLDEYQRKHMARLERKYADGQTFYERIRAEEPKDAVHVAARFIYLNKTCSNGLYRVNRSGIFNVPQGKHKNPKICDPDRLRDASKTLSKAVIRLGDFSKAQPMGGDVIYCDPPYDGCFTSYHKKGFDDEEQARLQSCASTWDENGATVILSNADTKSMRKLYEGWRIGKVSARHSIGQSVDSRTDAKELLITNG